MRRLTPMERGDGKASIRLDTHAAYVVRIVAPGAGPYRVGSHRARAWSLLCNMDGMTVQQVHDELKRKEQWIQGRDGRPLGWLVDAIDRGLAVLERSD